MTRKEKTKERNEISKENKTEKINKEKKKKFRALKIIIAVVLFIVLVAVTFFVVCYALAIQDNIKDKYTMTETDDSFMNTALKNAITGSTFEVSEVQLNTYINKKFCGEKEFLRKVRVYFYKDKPIEIYGQIHNWNRDFAIFARAETKLDKEKGIVEVKLSDVKLGELPIHDIVLHTILRDFADKNKYVTFSDGNLYVQSDYEYKFDDLKINLRLEQFDPQNGTIRCKTNSLSAEVINALKEYCLSEKGRDMLFELFGNLLSDMKENVKDKVEDIKDKIFEIKDKLFPAAS